MVAWWPARLPAVCGCVCVPQFLKQDTLYRFPYFTTYSLGYKPEAVHMLSQLSTAVIMDEEVQEQIRQLYEVADKGKCIH